MANPHGRMEEKHIPHILYICLDLIVMTANCVKIQITH